MTQDFHRLFLDPFLRMIKEPKAGLFAAIFLTVIAFYVELTLLGVWSENTLAQGSFVLDAEARLARRVLWFSFLTTISFCILQRSVVSLDHFPLRFSQKSALLHLSFAALFLSLLYFSVQRLSVTQDEALLWSWVRLIVGSLTAATLFPIFFDRLSLRELLFSYRKEWVVASGVSIVFLTTYSYSQQYWRPLAQSVGFILSKALALTDSKVLFDTATMTLSIRGMNFNIGEPCSGLEGMGLFLILFLAVLLLDWKRILKIRALFIFLSGFVVMFLANVFRIYLIALAGYWLAPRLGIAAAQKIVIEGFHTHLGWILYSVILLVFFRLSYLFWTAPLSTPESPRAVSK